MNVGNEHESPVYVVSVGTRHAIDTEGQTTGHHIIIRIIHELVYRSGVIANIYGIFMN